MGIGVILSSILVYFQLRYVFKDVNDLRFAEPQDVQGWFDFVLIEIFVCLNYEKEEEVQEGVVQELVGRNQFRGQQ